MAYIFLDESGDLGFDFSKKKTSRYFVISFLFCKKKRPIERIIKKVAGALSKKELKRHVGVLHCVKEKPKTRLRVLKLLDEKDAVIITIYLNKRKVYSRLQDEKQVLYNYITNILLDRVFTKKLIPLDQKIWLIASRRETNHFLNKNFQNYLKTQADHNHKIEIEVVIKAPHEEKCLQVVDFVCWSIFRKYEYGDESYANIFKNKIVEENPLFP